MSPLRTYAGSIETLLTPHWNNNDNNNMIINDNSDDNSNNKTIMIITSLLRTYAGSIETLAGRSDEEPDVMSHLPNNEQPCIIYIYIYIYT